EALAIPAILDEFVTTVNRRYNVQPTYRRYLWTPLATDMESTRMMMNGENSTPMEVRSACLWTVGFEGDVKLPNLAVILYQRADDHSVEPPMLAVTSLRIKTSHTDSI